MDFNHPVVVGMTGIFIGIPSTWLGYLSYRRSVRANNKLEQQGTTAQLGVFVDALQEDNTDLRQRNGELEKQLSDCLGGE